MNLSEISVTILAKNSEKYIKEVLKALGLFGEIILYDTGSADRTLEIAQTFPNVNIIRAPFAGFGPTHNMASAAAKNHWIFSIDSDEIATSELVEAIKAEELNAKNVYAFLQQ